MYVIPLLGIPPQVLFGQLLLGLINGAFYAMLSLGLAVIFGLLNIINFAHGALYMMGAFGAWLMLEYLGIGYWPALILSPIVVGAFGVLLEKAFLHRIYKLDHLYGLLLTFGMALIIEGLFRNYYGVSGQAYDAVPDLLKGGNNLGFMFLPTYRGWVVAASLIICFGTWFAIERTKLGSYLRAATENPKLVQAFGINVPRMITLTYGFGVALAAMAGVLAAPIYHVSPLMGSDIIIVVFAVVVIGGMGSIVGAVISGFGLGIIEGMTKVFYPEASNTVIFVVMAIVLLVSPPACSGRQRDEQREHSSAHCRGRHQQPDPGRARGPPGARDRGAVRALSDLPDEGAVLRAVRLGVQSAPGLRRALVLRPCRLLRRCRLYRGPRGEGAGLAAGTGPDRRHGGRGHHGRRVRLARHPASGHLFRHGDAGAGPDDLFRGARSEIHPWRGRHPGCAARQAPRPARPVRYLHHVLFRAGDFHRGLLADLPDNPFALRPGAEGDPRERAARHLAGLSGRPLQAAGFHAFGLAGRPGRLVEGAGVPAGVADRRRLAHVGAGRADDAGRRRRHGIRPHGRRLHPGDDGELPGPVWLVGDGHPGRDLRGLRADLPQE